MRQRGDKGGNDVAHFFEGVSSLGIPFRGKLLVGDGARKKNFEPESSVANEKGEGLVDSQSTVVIFLQARTHMTADLQKSFAVSAVASPARSVSSVCLNNFAATFASTVRDASDA